MKMRKAIGFVLVLGLAVCFAATNASAGLGSAVFGKSYGYGSWIALSTSYKVIYSMTFTVPGTVYAYVDCDGYAFLNNCEVEIAMGIDSTTEQPSTRRFYSYPVGDSDTSGLHTSSVWKFAKGTHTVNFLARTYNVGSGWFANANYMSISVLLFQTGGFKGPEAMEGEPGIAPDGSFE